jgi:hypothetical protein
MSVELSSRRVADTLEGIHQPDDQLQYVAHIISVYGFMTFRQIQELIGETIGGQEADCNSILARCP